MQHVCLCDQYWRLKTDFCYLVCPHSHNGTVNHWINDHYLCILSSHNIWQEQEQDFLCATIWHRFTVITWVLYFYSPTRQTACYHKFCRSVFVYHTPHFFPLTRQHHKSLPHASHLIPNRIHKKKIQKLARTDHFHYL